MDLNDKNYSFIKTKFVSRALKFKVSSKRDLLLKIVQPNNISKTHIAIPSIFVTFDHPYLL